MSRRSAPPPVASGATHRPDIPTSRKHWRPPWRFPNPSPITQARSRGSSGSRIEIWERACRTVSRLRASAGDFGSARRGNPRTIRMRRSSSPIRGLPSAPAFTPPSSSVCVGSTARISRERLSSTTAAVQGSSPSPPCGSEQSARWRSTMTLKPWRPPRPIRQNTVDWGIIDASWDQYDATKG